MIIKRVHHIAFAAHDASPLAAFFEGKLGMAEPYRERPEQSALEIDVYDAGNVALEVLRPTGPGSSVPAFLAEKGPGLFHVCFEVEDIDAAMSELASRGMRFRTPAPQAGHHGSRVVFLDTADTGGVLFELLQRGVEAAATAS